MVGKQRFEIELGHCIARRARWSLAGDRGALRSVLRGGSGADGVVVFSDAPPSETLGTCNIHHSSSGSGRHL